MIALIKPILFKFLGSKAVKELVVKLLEAYSKTTDNTVDDKLTALVKKNLLPEEYWRIQGLYPRKQLKRVLTSYTSLLQRTFYVE